MSPWKIVTLAEVANIERSGVQPEQIRDGTIYVGLEHIERGGRFIGLKPVDAGELASSKFQFTEQHILYGKLRPYLAKIACPEFSGICSTDILPILPRSNVDRKFLFHFLRQPKIVDYANSRAVGVNLPRLSPSVLANFEIPIPPLEEQRRIAEILDRAEELRSKRREAIAQLDTLTQAIFIEMFGDPATNPKGWIVDRLEKLIINSLQNGLYKHSSDYGSGTPILRIDAFYDGKVTKLSTLKRVRVSQDEQALYKLNEGDIVINRVNSMEYLGKSALIPPMTEPIVFESNMMRFSVNLEIIDSCYLVEFLQSKFIKGQILSSSKNAVNQSSINQQDVKGFLINIPPLPLQKEFAQRVEAVEKLKAAHCASLSELDALFASLQHRAFRGEL
ncbi:restriction endonuclease subunit S [Nostoc sp.]